MCENKLKFIDLFSGIGGFHISLQNNNCECVFASEIDNKCIEVYEDNYNIKPMGDISKIDEKIIPDFDILCGGFPCTSFSHSGKQEGFSHKTKGNLFFDICRILKHKQPSYFILENVKNLYGHDKGNTWKVIYNALIDIGYLTYEKPILASPLHFGIPQNRDRVFIIGLRKDLGVLPPYPIYKKQVTNIKSILEDDKNISENILNQVRLKDEQIKILDRWDLFILYCKDNNIKIPSFPIWSEEWDKDYDIKDLPKWKQNFLIKNRCFYNDNKNFLLKWLSISRKNKKFRGSQSKLEWQCGEVQLSDSIWTLLFQYRPSGIRIKRSNYSPALVAMSQIVYIGSKKRKLIPVEIKRLQSFPDSFKHHENINTTYKQFGNAVNVSVVDNIYKHLIYGMD
jgi:DNA (cytosine-5)-methyltransferase 1